ncbi:putative integral membrane protein [Colletotrichum sublineola]|uniref:Putative integral membrane protein n=1 Tax=Colletotrichum sublineola TaxID=1173701 RepID=A0A066X441_COLSU|nr:putative integral membrane protein [Colletotrichum sublineola]
MPGAGARGISLLIWIVVFTTIDASILCLRAWSAKLMRRPFYWDDGMIIFAFANVVALEGVVIWAIYNGLGKHTNELTLEEYAVQFKLILASGVTWLLGTVFIKMAILWLYTRLFSTARFKRWSRIVMGITGAYGVAFLILFMSRCTPMSQQWAPVPGGHCRDITIDQIVSVSINIVVDVAMTALPMPMLWGLQMPLKNKIAVSAMFAMGFATIGIMIWRLYNTLTTIGDPDFVFILHDIGLVSLLELWIGIIAACLPTLGPLFKTYVKPAVSKLTNPSTDKGSVQLNDVSNSGHSHRAPRRVYDKLGDTVSSVDDLERAELAKNGAVTTRCHFSPEFEPPRNSRPGIYVHQNIESETYPRTGPQQF